MYMYILIPYSGYISFEFNFVLFILIPCGTNIFKTKKAFPQCHMYKMSAQNENTTNENLWSCLEETFSGMKYTHYMVKKQCVYPSTKSVSGV